jgi:bifunctional DNA-binding transcriptional regulator/antitoxin component of YhaV-PrlF toxin-antitoxin module
MSKIPKEIRDAMNLDAQDRPAIFGNPKSTDFTPKKKISLMVRIKNRFNGLFNKIKKSKFLTNIKNWVDKTFIKPAQEKRAKKEHERYVKELKSNFSKKFNVNVEKTIKIMNQPGYSPYEVDNNQLLIENRLEINKRKSLHIIPPIMYSPEIVDIHNENLNKKNPTIDEIRANEDNKVSDTLDKQLEFFKKRPHLTVGGRKSPNTLKSNR